MMHKTVFTIGEMPQAYIGYTGNERWNGWACPYFEVNEGMEILKAFNECAESPMYYDEVNDTFRVDGTDDTDAEVWKGREYQTADGIKHLYAIGNGSWVWDDESVMSTATNIRNLLRDFDIDVDRKSIYDKLNDFSLFRKVVCIYRNDETAETKIQKLKGVFSI